jgi:transcriptional regulator GlxA family with amidase domain
MTTTDRVREYLKTADIGRVRFDDIARAMAMSRQTLQRRLFSEGVKYASLRDAEKTRRCMDLLSINPRPDIALVAKKTGFIQHSNAGRWFKSSMGITLREYKRLSAWPAGS